jgi:hypothetical protein
MNVVAVPGSKRVTDQLIEMHLASQGRVSPIGRRSLDPFRRPLGTHTSQGKALFRDLDRNSLENPVDLTARVKELDRTSQFSSGQVGRGTIPQPVGQPGPSKTIEQDGNRWFARGCLGQPDLHAGQVVTHADQAATPE